MRWKVIAADGLVYTWKIVMVIKTKLMDIIHMYMGTVDRHIRRVYMYERMSLPFFMRDGLVSPSLVVRMLSPMYFLPTVIQAARRYIRTYPVYVRMYVYVSRQTGSREYHVRLGWT